jgi:hypothetical protein
VSDNQDGRRFWMGGSPTRCDACEAALRGVFYDAATRFGAWGILCPTCHVFGPGLGRTGSGRGQKYERQDDGRWLKTEG